VKKDEKQGKTGELLKRYRENKGYSQVEAAKEAGITNQLLWSYEQAKRKVKPEHLLKLLTLYGIKKDTFDTDILLLEKKTSYLREILTQLGIKLAVIVSDINKDEVSYPDSDKTIQEDTDSESVDRELPDREWVIGGGAFYASKAAIEYGFLPVVFSTVGKGNAGDELLREFEKETSAADNKPGVITTWIEKHPTLDNSTCKIEFKKEATRKDTQHQYKNHCNDFQLLRLIEAVSSSGAGRDDFIFVHGFRLNRRMLEFKADTTSKKDIQKQKYVTEFMASLLPGNSTIVFDLAPPDIYDNLTMSELELIIDKSDVIVAELRSLLGFLKSEKVPANVEKAIRDDFGKGKTDININGSIDKKIYYPLIIDKFLGSHKGNLLIIRYGTGHMDDEAIIERLEDGAHGKHKIEINNTRYSKTPTEKRLGFGDRRTFEVLKERLAGKK